MKEILIMIQFITIFILSMITQAQYSEIIKYKERKEREND